MSKVIAVIAPGRTLLKEHVDAVREAGIPIAVISNVYEYALDAEYCYSGDGRWWEHHWDEMNKLGFKGRRITAEASTAGVYGTDGLEWVEHVPDYVKIGLPAKGKVTGTSSGHHILCFLVNEGYTDIILLGFEYGAAGDGHYFGGHPTGFNAPPSDWPVMIEEMGPLAARIAAQGVRVTNCTEVTALRCFRKATLSEALAKYQSKPAKARRSARQDAVSDPAST